MDWMSVVKELTPYLRQGQLDYCISRVSAILADLPHSPYHLVLDLDFTNDPHEVAASFDQFVTMIAQKQVVAALYTETNGFFINPGWWYFQIFSYSTYKGHADYDWLAYWQKPASEAITLTGLEALQAVYQHHEDTQYFLILDYGGDPQVEQMQVTKGFCDLLVVLRFQNLIRRSAVWMQQVRVPLLATSHDYDFIYEVHPSGPVEVRPLPAQ